MDHFNNLDPFVFNPHLRTCLLILERGEGRERDRERNISWLRLAHTLTGGPDWESNLQPFSLQDDVPTNQGKNLYSESFWVCVQDTLLRYYSIL